MKNSQCLMCISVELIITLIEMQIENMISSYEA